MDTNESEGHSSFPMLYLRIAASVRSEQSAVSSSTCVDLSDRRALSLRHTTAITLHFSMSNFVVGEMLTTGTWSSCVVVKFQACFDLHFFIFQLNLFNFYKTFNTIYFLTFFTFIFELILLR